MMNETKETGQLEVIIGPMFSGKTSELIRRIQQYHLANYRCLIVKHSVERNFSATSITSHDGHSLPAILVSNLQEIHKLLQDFDVIGIDQAHLFSDLNVFCEEQCDGGKNVIVAALDKCDEKVFKEVLGLIPLAESVTKLNAICMSCAKDAIFTKSVLNQDLPSKEEKFISVCGDCYYSSKNTWRSPFTNYLSDGVAGS